MVLKEKMHFHSLDALRFFAFLKVFLLHIPTQGKFPVFDFLKRCGGIGVMFFFVLSGFLITYILVFEKMNQGNLNFRRFFRNRALRIWPLFYLALLPAFLLPDHFLEITGMHMAGGYEPDWRFSFSFLDNYKMIYMDNCPKTTPLLVMWSLCIEEHFYIIWSLLLVFMPYKKMPYLIAGSVVVAILSRMVFPIFVHNQYVKTNEILTNIDLFAIGGLLGYYVALDYDRLAAYVTKIPYNVKWLFIFFVILIVLFEPEIFYTDALQIIQPTVLAVLFTLLLAVFMPVKSKIKVASTNIFSVLGRLSYGLYIFHIFFIHVLFKYCLDQKIILNTWTNLMGFVIITLLLSTITAWLSYNYFEKVFLKFKR